MNNLRNRPAINGGRVCLRRPGFTAVELFVAVTVIGVLAASLIPAVMQARESARRMQCQSNLKQMGVALHDYHDTNGAFPPGWTSIQFSQDGSIVRPVDLGCLWAWGAYLLPQLDQAPLHDHLGVLGVVDPPPPGERFDVALPMFVCPSDAGGHESGWGLYRWNDTDPVASLVKGYAKSNYAAVNGSGAAPFQLIYDPSDTDLPTAGIFGNETRTRFQDVRDGTSHTLAVGEREMTRSHDKERPRGAVWIRNVGELVVGFDRTTPAVAGTLSDDPPPDAVSDDSLLAPFAAIHCDANSVVGVTGAAAPLNRTSTGFSSLHPGGALFLFADGSVRFLSDEIDPDVYGLLGSMSDGRHVPDF